MDLWKFLIYVAKFQVNKRSCLKQETQKVLKDQSWRFSSSLHTGLDSSYEHPHTNRDSLKLMRKEVLGRKFIGQNCLLFFQRIQVCFSVPTWVYTTKISAPGSLTPFSGLLGTHTSVHMHVLKNQIYLKSCTGCGSQHLRLFSFPWHYWCYETWSKRGDVTEGHCILL